MKIALYVIAIILLVINCSAQMQTISAAEYEKTFQFAVRETNADYPFIFKVTTTTFDLEKIIQTQTEEREAESPGHERIKITNFAGGRKSNIFQIKVGFGNVFCSDDSISWKPSKYECSGSRIIFGRSEPESIEYSVENKSKDGKKIKIYHKYSVFATFKGDTKFSEQISTIDSRGFFIAVIDTEGTTNPKTITLKREQSWETKAKIKSIVSPIK
jgi:hypothetical protein